MAGLAATVAQEYRRSGIGNFDEFENRKATKGVLSAAIDSTNASNSIVTPQIESLVAGDTYGVDKKIIVLNKDNSAANTTRSCSPDGDESVSALYALTRNTVSKDLTVYPSIYGQNDVARMEDIAKKMRDIEHALAKGVEDAIITDIDAGINQESAYNSPFVGAGARYEILANAMQVAASEQEFFFNDIPAIMMADDVDTSMGVQVLGNPTLSSYVNKYGNQGGANAVNLGYQFSPFEFYYANGIDVTAGQTSTGYAIPMGHLGLLFQNTPDAVRGATAGDGTMWYTTILPENLLGTPVSVLEKSSCADASGLGSSPVGLEATEKVVMQFSVDYYVLTPYSSVDAESPIYKFDFA